MSTVDIHRIQHRASGKSYIGVASDIMQLIKNSGSVLGSDWAIYGASEFILEKLETISLEKLQGRLRHLIIKHNSLYPYGYNLFLGRRMAERPLVAPEPSKEKLEPVLVEEIKLLSLKDRIALRKAKAVAN